MLEGLGTSLLKCRKQSGEVLLRLLPRVTAIFETYQSAVPSEPADPSRNMTKATNCHQTSALDLASESQLHAVRYSRRTHQLFKTTYGSSVGDYRAPHLQRKLPHQEHVPLRAWKTSAWSFKLGLGRDMSYSKTTIFSFRDRVHKLWRLTRSYRWKWLCTVQFRITRHYICCLIHRYVEFAVCLIQYCLLELYRGF